jgi:hypothetical protein
MTSSLIDFDEHSSMHDAESRKLNDQWRSVRMGLVLRVYPLFLSKYIFVSRAHLQMTSAHVVRAFLRVRRKRS